MSRPHPSPRLKSFWFSGYKKEFQRRGAQISPLRHSTDMVTPAVFSTVLLLAYCAGIHACDKDDSLVVLTACQLREEIADQLNTTLAESLPEPPTCPPPDVNATCLITREDKTAIVDSVKAAVSTTVEDLLLTEFAHLITPGYTPYLPATSCKEILQVAPQSPSGLYWIRGTDNGPKHMYCDMERSCKGVAGGWMRVASIDMTDTSSTCPSGLTTLTSPRRRCAMDVSGPACSSAVLPVQGIQYSQVCGKVIGYQDKTPDAFHRFITGQNTIDSNYVDGISITHGQSPRKHIWTFAAAVHEHSARPELLCPCTNTQTTSPTPVPRFIGNDYFCDTGSANHFQFIFYGDDPLWDGAGCGQHNTCCSFNSPPWFRKQLTTPTSDNIEMRLCTDQNQNDEQINFEILELYVQ